MKKKTLPQHNDFGTPELLSHGEFVVEETISAGVKRLRNTTHDPIAMYYRRKLINPKQFLAAETVAFKFRQGNMAQVFASVEMQKEVRSSLLSSEINQVTLSAKKDCYKALDHVGDPLNKLIIHCVGMGHTAGSWSGIRKGSNGMTALRLALDGLKTYYKL